jgi:alpha-1,3-rhamnosyl/mannosyltransferase
MVVGIDARLALARGRGWGRYAAELLRELALCRAGGVEIRVLLPDVPEAARLGSQIGGALVVVTEPFADAGRRDYAERALEASDPTSSLGPVDVVHSLTRFAPHTRVPRMVATVHDIAPLSATPFKWELAEATRVALARLSERHAEIIAVSASTKGELCERTGLAAERITVIPQGVPARYLAASTEKRGSEREPGAYVLYVGGAGPNKNLRRLIEAVALVRRSLGDLRLVLLGAPSWGYDEFRRQLPTDLGRDASWVEFRGLVDEEDLVSMYRHAAVVAVPSLHEGFGLPLLEGFALGAPVCCSSIPVFEEITGDAAWTFDPKEVRDIARALLEVLASPDLARHLRRLGRLRASGLTWRETARRTLALYERIGDRAALEDRAP